MGKSYLKKDKREIAWDKWKSEGRRQSQYLEEGIGFDVAFLAVSPLTAEDGALLFPPDGCEKYLDSLAISFCRCVISS
jgi:hypothetical protein